MDVGCDFEREFFGFVCPGARRELARAEWGSGGVDGELAAVDLVEVTEGKLDGLAD